ncbi:hypothetical protein GCM10020295_02740 [Streptomyces cinereospinus]
MRAADAAVADDGGRAGVRRQEEADGEHGGGRGALHGQAGRVEQGERLPGGQAHQQRPGGDDRGPRRLRQVRGDLDRVDAGRGQYGRVVDDVTAAGQVDDELAGGRPPGVGRIPERLAQRGQHGLLGDMGSGDDSHSEQYIAHHEGEANFCAL